MNFLAQGIVVLAIFCTFPSPSFRRRNSAAWLPRWVATICPMCRICSIYSNNSYQILYSSAFGKSLIFGKGKQIDVLSCFVMFKSSKMKRNQSQGGLTTNHVSYVICSFTSWGSLPALGVYFMWSSVYCRVFRSTSVTPTANTERVKVMWSTRKFCKVIMIIKLT